LFTAMRKVPILPVPGLFSEREPDGIVRPLRGSGEMTLVTWAKGINGNWTTAADWNPNTPGGPSGVDVSLPEFETSGVPPKPIPYT
jgi:hypothetical protein